MSFDRKFGADFLKQVPLSPGVYEMTDAQGQVIYVGKAKILRRRLGQYRNAKRCKRHHKMRKILKEAVAIRYHVVATEIEALLLENQKIQELRPKFNVAGAFSFLYPFIGMMVDGPRVYFCYTTNPKTYSMFELYGAYRSRFLTREAYFGLVGILDYLSHREEHRKLRHMPRERFSYTSGFRQVPSTLVPHLCSFLRGESSEFLVLAVNAMLEKAMARRRAAEVQEHLNDLKRFFKFEARALHDALAWQKNLQELGPITPMQSTVAQEERDTLFLRYRERKVDKRQKDRVKAVISFRGVDRQA